MARFACLLLAASLTTVQANQFLHARSGVVHEQVARAFIEQTLQSELSMDQGRLSKFEDELRPMFAALPKGPEGDLQPTTVRFALHRYFVQKHGWYVKGLEPNGAAWNSTSPTGVMTDRVPAFIQNLFEERLHGKGMGLHDLAIFAATMEDLVHNEAYSDLLDIFHGLSFNTTDILNEDDRSKVIRAYMLTFLSESSKIQSDYDYVRLSGDISRDFPAWGDFMDWVQDMRHTLNYEQSRRSLKVKTITFDNVAEEVQQLNDRIGAFQNIECQSLKEVLSDMDYQDRGRVLIADFYRRGLDGDWLFVENIQFLDNLGVLDHDDPRGPAIIIPNYMTSKANCLASSNFHSVCCIAECEGLMGKLETTIGEPSASPQRIAEAIGRIQSTSVDAPWNVSAPLMSRLSEIAEHHGGSVPIHGRLFAQFMHHAYPLECPFPHEVGTFSPMTAEEWMDSTGLQDVAAPRAEREMFVNAVAKASYELGGGAPLPWTGVEELVQTHTEQPKMTEKKPDMARKVAAVVAIGAFAWPLVHASKVLLASDMAGAKAEKHLV